MPADLTSTPCPANTAFVAASVLVAMDQVKPADWLILTTRRRLCIATGPTLADAASSLPDGEEVKDACLLTDSSHPRKLREIFPTIISI